MPIRKFADATFGATHTLTIEIAKFAHDDLDVGGELNLDGTLEVLLLDMYVPGVGTMWTLATADGGINGVFSELIFPSVTGLRFALAYGSNDLVLTAAAVPVPASFCMLLSAIAVLALRLQRSRLNR